MLDVAIWSLNSWVLSPSEPRYVRVVIDRAIHRELDYAVPETLAERVNIGSRLRVPFREKSALATVLAVLDQSDAEGIRPIEAIVGEAPILTEPLLELAKWMAAYYCCPIETVIRSLLPQVVRKAEVGWKKQLFVQPAGEIASEEIEKLRRRAPRQAELLEAITRLEQPVRAAELLRQTALDNPAQGRKDRRRQGHRFIANDGRHGFSGAGPKKIGRAHV